MPLHGGANTVNLVLHSLALGLQLLQHPVREQGRCSALPRAFGLFLRLLGGLVRFIRVLFELRHPPPAPQHVRQVAVAGPGPPHGSGVLPPGLVRILPGRVDGPGTGDAGEVAGEDGAGAGPVGVHEPALPPLQISLRKHALLPQHRCDPRPPLHLVGRAVVRPVLRRQGSYGGLQPYGARPHPAQPLGQGAAGGGERLPCQAGLHSPAAVLRLRLRLRGRQPPQQPPPELGVLRVGTQHPLHHPQQDHRQGVLQPHQHPGAEANVPHDRTQGVPPADDLHDAQAVHGGFQGAGEVLGAVLLGGGHVHGELRGVGHGLGLLPRLQREELEIRTRPEQNANHQIAPFPPLLGRQLEIPLLGPVQPQLVECYCAGPQQVRLAHFILVKNQESKEPVRGIVVDGHLKQLIKLGVQRRCGGSSAAGVGIVGDHNKRVRGAPEVRGGQRRAPDHVDRQQAAQLQSGGSVADLPTGRRPECIYPGLALLLALRSQHQGLPPIQRLQGRRQIDLEQIQRHAVLLEHGFLCCARSAYG
mmetsp:Transcript_80257/g.214461  ORF Transcript_80257/g.214461 Transcript_80257/m.214461 type:complete len:530 (-) Transcript_80257:231-1820(-)